MILDGYNMYLKKICFFVFLSKNIPPRKYKSGCLGILRQPLLYFVYAYGVNL